MPSVKNLRTTNPLTGEFELVIARPGVDVDTVGAADYADVHYHSDWSATEEILLAGRATWDFYRSRPHYDTAYCCAVEFPDPGFLPIVTTSVFSGDDPVNQDSWARHEDWNKISTGGDDPYCMIYPVYVQPGVFFFCRNSNYHGFGGGASSWLFSFEFIVWNLRAEPLL